jgi:hypothetical protein
VFLPCILWLVLSFGAQEPPGGWITVSAGGPEVAAAAVLRIERDAAASLDTLRPAFRGLPRHPFRIIVHGSASDLPPELAALHDAGSPGFALPSRHEIHVLLAECHDVRGFQPVLAHEITHELLEQLAQPWGDRLPRWFHEGMAQVLAGDTYLDASEDLVVWRIPVDNLLLPFSELERGFPRDPVLLRLAYAQSFSYVKWLEGQLGRDGLLALVKKIDDETTLLRALVIATGRNTSQLEDAWRDYLLNQSGAPYRALLRNCFSLLMIFSLPLLALALRRRLRAEAVVRERLERQEAAELAAREAADLGADEAYWTEQAAADDAADAADRSADGGPAPAPERPIGPGAGPGAGS